MQVFDLSYESVPCALCGSDDHRLLWSIADAGRRAVYVHGVRGLAAAPGQIVRCSRCRLAFVNPRVVPQPEVSTYSDVEGTPISRPPARRALWATRGFWPASLGRLAGRAGCSMWAAGMACSWPRRARRAGTWPGWRYGPGLCSAFGAQDAELQIHQGSLENGPFLEASFDVVTLINVLEHVRDPLRMVVECRRLVRPGGLVAVHVPNVGGLPARLRGARWKHYEPLEHLYYFNRRTLRALLERCGLQVCAAFVLLGSPSMLGWFLAFEERFGLSWGNSLGLLARRVEGA